MWIPFGDVGSVELDLQRLEDPVRLRREVLNRDPLIPTSTSGEAFPFSIKLHGTQSSPSLAHSQLFPLHH